jgi:FtsH-binding integral membrane protein
MHIISIGVIIYFVTQIQSPYKSENDRLIFLGGLAFFLGFLIGPAINMLLEFEPTIVLQALMITAAVFTSFSFISLYSKRRSFLFLGGIIMTLIQGMMLYKMFGWLFGYNTLNIGYLMVSLFTCCLFIIYDTQLIIEKAERGEKDVPAHAMRLFIDLFDLFIKIIQILMKLKEGEEDRDRRRKK